MPFLLSLEQTAGGAGPDGLERAGHVAALAETPEAAVVHVLFFVATEASRSEVRPALRRELVAGEEIRAAVLPVENERGATVVIEIPLLPAARVVALLAQGSKPQ